MVKASGAQLFSGQQVALAGKLSVLSRRDVRAIVERIRPNTAVLAQSEISPRARIRTVGTI